MTFRVGQKVVCVEDDFAERNKLCRIPTHYPKTGQVYTIRSFVSARGRVFVRLIEIINQPEKLLGNVEPAFWVERFRPVVETKTDISIFTSMLKPSRVDA